MQPTNASAVTAGSRPNRRASRVCVTVALALLSTVAALLAPSVAQAAPGDLALASTTALSVKGNRNSNVPPSLSADGTKVAFVSDATNLDARDTDPEGDVYVKNLMTGQLFLADVNPATGQKDGSARAPVLSPDGTKVAYTAIPGPVSGAFIYVTTLATGSRITVVPGPEAGSAQSWSADGTKLAILTPERLVPADTDSFADAYVYDLATATFTLASPSKVAGRTPGSVRDGVFLSGDGTKVVFWSGATDLDPNDNDARGDVYLSDLTTNTIRVISTTGNGTKGNGNSSPGGISADGTLVVISSDATNFDPRATVQFVNNVYVKNLLDQSLTLISTSGGSIGNGSSGGRGISADGSRVAFASNSTNLLPADTDSFFDVYVKELATDTLYLASTSPALTKGNRDSRGGPLSANGTKVAFYSEANNLLPADPDHIQDVYVKELPPPAPVAGPTLDCEPPDGPGIRCQAIDASGIRRIVVVDTSTKVQEQNIALSCKPNRKTTNVHFSIADDGNRHRVAITACSGAKKVFIVNPNGSIT